jgi:hypothetical protein
MKKAIVAVCLLMLLVVMSTVAFADGLAIDKIKAQAHANTVAQREGKHTSVYKHNQIEMIWRSILMQQHQRDLEKVCDALPSRTLSPDMANMKLKDGSQYQFVVMNDEQAAMHANKDSCGALSKTEQGNNYCVGKISRAKVVPVQASATASSDVTVNIQE